MPLYEYKCNDCRYKFTFFKSLEERNENLSCPKCKSEKVKRIISSFAMIGARESKLGDSSYNNSSESEVVYPDDYLESLPPCHELRRGKDFVPDDIDEEY